MEPKPTVADLYKEALTEKNAQQRAEDAWFALTGLFIGVNFDNLTQPEVYGSDFDFIPLGMSAIAMALDYVHSKRVREKLANYQTQTYKEGHVSNQKLDEADKLLIQARELNNRGSMVNMFARASEGVAIGLGAENVVYERSINNVQLTLFASASIGLEIVKIRLARQRDKLIKTAQELYKQAGKYLAAQICSLTLKQ